jgi:hypothetical protein
VFQVVQWNLFDFACGILFFTVTCTLKSLVISRSYNPNILLCTLKSWHHDYDRNWRCALCTLGREVGGMAGDAVSHVAVEVYPNEPRRRPHSLRHA